MGTGKATGEYREEGGRGIVGRVAQGGVRDERQDEEGRLAGRAYMEEWLNLKRKEIFHYSGLKFES